MSVHWKLRLGAFSDLVQESLWFFPTIGLAIAIAAAELLPSLDSVTDSPPWFETNAESARTLLSAIATATLTLTGLVFSITMLVLQLASAQLSPRVMGHFLRDRHNQSVLAILIATFAYALLAIPNVAEGSIPSFTVWVGFALGMVSVGAFIHYIDHMAQSIRASRVVQDVGDETRAAIERMYPDVLAEGDGDLPEPEPPPGDPRVVMWEGRRAGVIVDGDGGRLAEASERHDVHVMLVPRIGDFLPTGAPVFHVWGELDDRGREALRATIAVGSERSMRRDPAFGIRQLVDIAARALSPSVNDPTTAVQAIDQIHDILRILSTKRLGPLVFRAERGRGMAVVRQPDWEDFVALAIDEVRLSGAHMIQVQRRLRFLVDDLLAVAPPQRQPPLRVQLRLLDAALEAGFDSRSDRGTARQPSAQGHGT